MDKITQLPPAPTPLDPVEVFDDKAFNLVDALDQFVEEANGLIDTVNTEADRAEATMEYIDGRAKSASASASAASNEATRSRNEANRSKLEADKAKLNRDESETLYEMTSIAAGEAIEHVSSLALMQKQIINSDWVIPTGYNALVIGDLNVNPGVTVTGVGTATLRGM